MSLFEKRSFIEVNHEQISVTRQCELLDMARSSYYFQTGGDKTYNLYLMRLIDEEYTRHPFYGSRRFVAWLRNLGHEVNRKRIQRLMREIGIEAIYPKPNLSKRNKEHKIYPYLLRDVKIEYPDHVWSTDITYIRMNGGFVYLTAIIDWYSRYVLSFRLSNSLDCEFCMEALEEALSQGKPKIFNTDQGVQYTSNIFTARLNRNDILISMDGRGRALDNIFIERLWRSVKYEEVYLKDYKTVAEAYSGLEAYFNFYNKERFHQGLDYRRPVEVYRNEGLN